jgi:oxygen-independent coproporphyrinogen-3 oxidase
MAGIYLHIPFCKQACTYCSFHFSTSLQRKDDMVQALFQEVDLAWDYLKGAPLETIYFGGGTPSLLSAGEVNQLTDKILSTFPVEALKEVTLEANPDDLSPVYLKALRGTLINRFSIGVQSFHDEDLRYMNRAHNAQQADYAVKAAQDVGFTNLSIDLIYGTPGLTDAAWRGNLAQVKALGIPHLSSYGLTVEEGTALHHAIAKKKTTPVDAAQNAAQFEILMEAAPTLGYEHYEISNFAQPGQYAVHNTAYWQGKPYLGLGPSAHSFDGTARRRWNVANNAHYLQSILTAKIIPYEEETLTPVERLNEYIMTSLRTMWGCSLDKIAAGWDGNYVKQILEAAQAFIDDGRLIAQENTLLLTKKGKLFADGIASELFQDAENR